MPRGREGEELSGKGERDFWKSPFKTRGLLYKTVGIIGVGAVAKKLMEYLKPFNVKIKVYDTYTVDKEFLKSVNGIQTNLEEVLKTSFSTTSKTVFLILSILVSTIVAI